MKKRVFLSLTLMAFMCQVDQVFAESSVDYVFAPIAACLQEALAYLHLKDLSDMMPANELQQSFLERYVSEKGLAQLALFSEDELKTWASADIDELNQRLKSGGFDIRLSKGGPGQFGVVSILDILLSWKEPAKRTSIVDPQSQDVYDAIELNERAHSCSFYTFEGYADPAVRVQMASGDAVWFAVAGTDSPSNGFALRDNIIRLKGAKKNSCYTYDKLVVPMIDLSIQKELSWLLGLTLKPDYTITQAVQQTKFKMNEFGAHVASAAAISVESCCAPAQTYSIDKPFYIWGERDGMQEPYFMLYADKSVWHDPGTLSVK